MNRNLIIFLVIMCILAGVLFFTKGRFEPEPVHTADPGLIAKVGPREIRVEDFQQEVRRRGGAHPEQIDKNALLDEMIEDEALMAKAIETGLDKDPEIMRAYRNMLISAFKKRYLLPRIKEGEVTDAEVQTYYKTHPDEFTRPAKVRLALLYMAIPSKSSAQSSVEAVRAKIVEVRKKALDLQAERGFGSLAVNYSDDQTTRYKGGDIGWVEEGNSYRWDSAVLSAGFALENIGDISDIIVATDGFYLVKLLDRRSAEVMQQDKAAARIRYKLMQEKEKNIEKVFQEEMRAAIEIVIYPEILASVPLPALPDAGVPDSAGFGVK